MLWHVWANIFRCIIFIQSRKNKSRFAWEKLYRGCIFKSWNKNFSWSRFLSDWVASTLLFSIRSDEGYPFFIVFKITYKKKIELLLSSSIFLNIHSNNRSLYTLSTGYPQPYSRLLAPSFRRSYYYDPAFSFSNPQCLFERFIHSF